MGLQEVDRISPVRPTPSLLTSARDRSGDNFGRGTRSVDIAEGEATPVVTPNWTTGIEWNPTACAPSSPWPRCPDSEDEKVTPSERGSVGTDAFAIYTPMACEWTLPESNVLDEASRELTDVHTAFALARALWLGDGLPDELKLTDGTVVRPPTLRRVATALTGTWDLDDAVGQLLAHYEECTGGNGGAVLHVPSILITAALGGSPVGGWLARPEGDRYRGPLGSIVSPGPGYPFGASSAGADGFGPRTAEGPPETYAGNTNAQAWVYVTGPVEYALTDIKVLPENEDDRRPAMGRTNKYEVWAERMGIVRFDPCCVFGALVTAPAGAFA